MYIQQRRRTSANDTFHVSSKKWRGCFAYPSYPIRVRQGGTPSSLEWSEGQCRAEGGAEGIKQTRIHHSTQHANTTGKNYLNTYSTYGFSFRSSFWLALIDFFVFLGFVWFCLDKGLHLVKHTLVFFSLRFHFHSLCYNITQGAGMGWRKGVSYGWVAEEGLWCPGMYRTPK